MRTTFQNGISLMRPIAGPVGAFVEFSTIYSEEFDAWSGLVNAGLTYRVSKNLLLHAGSTFDVEAEVDFVPYLGLTWRL